MTENTLLDPIQLLDVPARHAAVIRLNIPRTEIQRHMGPAMMEVMQTVQRLGVAPTGPMFSFHHTFELAYFDFEVGVPVAAPITPTGRVIASVRPATTRRGMGKIEGSGRWMLMKLRRWRTRPANGARPDPGRD